METENNNTITKNEQNEKQKPSPSAYARYSGMAFQIGGAVILGVLIGKWLDAQFDTSKHVFTTLFSIMGIFISAYAIIKTVAKK